MRSRPRPSGKEQSREGGGIENRHCLGGALDLLEVHCRLLDQPQKKNGSALSQSGQMGPPNIITVGRGSQCTTACTRREDGRARADGRAPSQTSTATPRTRSSMGYMYFVGMEANAIHPAYIGICGQTS